jgi:hypothetical protein
MAFMDINLNGTAFTDYLLTNVGSGLFNLEHDWFTQQDLIIRTAAAGGGTLLVEGVDFTLSTDAALLSLRATAEQSRTVTVYTFIQITNVTYQTGNLYFSGEYIADTVEAEDVQYNVIKTVSSANYTILDDDGYGWIKVTTGNSDRTINLPTVAANTNRQITIGKVDSGSGKVIIDGENAETINGAATYNVIPQYDNVILRSNGTFWEVLSSYVLTSNRVSDATELNTASVIVKRDGSGNFAAGTITASLTGNCSGSSGSCTGNAVTSSSCTGNSVTATTAGLKGSSTFVGNSSARTIAHGFTGTPNFCAITPSADPAGYLGEVWYTADATNIYVYNSGSAVTAFKWFVC